MQRHTRVVVKSDTSFCPSRLFLAAFVAVAVVAGVGLLPVFALDASAQNDSDPALDAIRAEIPEGNPGKSDLTEASQEFRKLVELYGQTTQIVDFGDGSMLIGPCGGYAYSYDKNGALLDAAMDVGDGSPPVDLLDGLQQAFTSGNPFKVDPRGVVTYYGFSPEDGDGPRNHEWFIKTSGISLDKGGDPNTNLKNRNTGLVDLANDLPVKFTAKIKIEGEMMSENLATCVGRGHVSVEGDGLTDPVGLAGLALLGGGLFGLLFNARPAMTYKA